MNRHALARFIRRWHARLGVTAALFFIVLIVTGLMLNHDDRLGLAQRSIQSPALARWYGLPAAKLLAVYDADGRFIATPAVWLYRDHALPDSGGAVVGVVHTTTALAVATTQSLRLYTPGGEKIDTLSGSALPQPGLLGLGQLAGEIAIRTPQSSYASADGMTWRAISGEGVSWSRARPVDTEARASVAQQLTPALPLERVVLDLHSGRLFGRYGPLLTDAAALILLALSLSGLWIQLRSWQQKRKHPHHH
jgi:hypothetical protein